MTHVPLRIFIIQPQSVRAFKFFFFHLFVYFGCTGSSLLHMGLSLVALSWDYSVAVVPGLLTAVSSLVADNGSRARGLQ